MATLKTIRKRIGSVKNTQKITKAMKMVSAAKLRRAQTRLINARPYSNKMQEILSNLFYLMPEEEKNKHPLLQNRNEIKTAEFLIITSDRGLCGGFNGNLLRRIDSVLKEKSLVVPEVKITVSGRRGRDYFRARKKEPDQFITGMPEDVPFEKTLEMANDLIKGYIEGRFDEFYLVYNYFRSAISQEIRIERILPFELQPSALEGSNTYLPTHIYEPTRTEVLNDLIPRALAMMIRRAFLESIAGEYGARMVAMDNATSNSSDMIYDLTLQMNRLRQAVITTELMDIVNGAEALK
ncbi:MAG: ATP synthase F1 subunit gamma [Deltaproteobacteria bacterium]|nr:MAG: ATP synthase F1 subunit gamma [Deltaproteobacteria bacterium]